MLDLVHKSKGQLIAPKEVIKSIEVLCPEAVDTIALLMREGKTDTVRLKASLEVLALAGINRETTIKVKTDITEMDDVSINDRLNELLGTAALTVLEGEAKDITEEVDSADEKEEEEANFVS
jgi:hypothetical protein